MGSLYLLYFRRNEKTSYSQQLKFGPLEIFAEYQKTVENRDRVMERVPSKDHVFGCLPHPVGQLSPHVPGEVRIPVGHFQEKPLYIREIVP